MLKLTNLRRLAIAAPIGLWVLGQGIGQAVQLADGTVYFDHPPLLTDNSASRNDVNDNSPAYFFSFEIPDDAGEPLQSVEFVQRNGDFFTREIEFEPDETEAFTGTRRNRGDSLPVAATTFDEETQTATVTFAQPVAPGTNLTIRLEADRNPRQSGVYLFGVTAYPAGASPYGQFLGYARFHIYDNSDSELFD